MSRDQQVPQPPKPPKIEQRVNLSRGQLFGLPVMLLIPILALFGVFGMTEESASRSEEDLALTVHYSGRTQFLALHDLVIEVTNQSSRPLEGVTVALNRAFVDSFAQVSFTPSTTGATGTEYLFDLGTVPGSATRIISARLAAGSYWSLPGTVTVFALEGPAIEFEFQTFVYP